MEKIIKTINPIYIDLISKLRELEKQFNNYKKNCLIKMNYELDKDIDDYENKVIEGESTLDMILEEFERSNSLFDICEEILAEIAKVYNFRNSKEMLNLRLLILTSYKKRINERSILENRREKILKNLFKISKNECFDETTIEFDKIKRENDNFKEFKECMNEKRISYFDYRKYGMTKDEKKQMERWCKSKMNGVIFDSDVNNWRKGHSIFDLRIRGYSKLIFLIETINGVKFGGYVSSLIDTFGYVRDENAFVFTFYNHTPMKFDIRDSYSSGAFRLFDRKDKYLFGFGYKEIMIEKKGLTLNIKDYSPYGGFCFKYPNGMINALIGRRGNNCSSIRRILVISMSN